ncbi:hypothetical protein [Brevibacillus brevis]|uniref:hypothetical protein n=1 Tax=Brevibacillus brevis TaxID=1393 RepID=UPI003D208D4F
MKHEALRLYDYHVWANEKVFERLQEVPEEVSEQEVPRVFRPSPDIGSHSQNGLCLVVAMKGESYEEVGPKVAVLLQDLKGKNVHELRKLFAESAQQFRDFFGQISMEDTAPYTHPALGTVHARYADIVNTSPTTEPTTEAISPPCSDKWDTRELPPITFFIVRDFCGRAIDFKICNLNPEREYYKRRKVSEAIERCFFCR